MVTSYTNLATSHQKLNQLEQAKIAFEKAIKYINEADESSIHTQTRCYYNLGCIYFDEGQVQKSAPYFEKALGLFNRFSSPPTIDQVDCLNKLGYSKLDSGDKEAASFFEKSVESTSEVVPLSKRAFAGFYLAMARLAVASSNKTGVDENKVVEALKVAREALETLSDNETTDEMFKVEASSGVKSSKDWYLVHYYLADSLNLLGSSQDAFQYLSTVQHLHKDQAKDAGPSLLMLREDRFTGIDLSSQFWELYLRTAKAKSNYAEGIQALLRLLKLKEKTLNERDKYRMDLAALYELDRNPQMAIKYYQVLSAKAEDIDVRTKAKKKLNDLLNEVETRSANTTQSKRANVFDDRKDVMSSRSYRSGNKSVGKQSNMIVFTPSVKAKKELNESKEDSKDAKSVVQSTDDSRSEHQKLVFKQRTPSGKSSNQNSPLKDESKKSSHIDLRSNYISDTAPKLLKGAQGSQSNYRSDRQPRKSQNESLDSSTSGKISSKADTHKSTKIQPKINMTKVEKQPTVISVVSGQKTPTKPKVEVPTHKPTVSSGAVPKKEITSPSKAANPKYLSMNAGRKQEDSNQKRSPTKKVESREAISKGSKERTKEPESSSRRSAFMSVHQEPSQPQAKHSVTKQQQTATPVSGTKATQVISANHVKMSHKKPSIEMPKKTPAKVKDIMDSPELKTKLKVFDVNQFRPDETFGQPLREKPKPKPMDELLVNIENFLIRILNVIEDKKYEEAESYLQKYRIILESTNKDGSTNVEHVEFENFLEAKIEIHKGKLERAEALLLSVVNFFRNSKNYIEKLPASRPFFELADIYLKQLNFMRAIEVYCNYLHIYSSIDSDGTLEALKLLFALIEQCNQKTFDRIGAKTISDSALHNQVQIIKKLEELETLPFWSIRSPIKALKTKRLECLLVLVSAYFMGQMDKKAEENLDRFLYEVDINERDHVALLKEMFETLLAAQRSNLALKYLKRVESSLAYWPHESSDLYLAMVCTKLGLMSKNDHKYSEGLLYFEMSLDFFKKLETLTLANSQEELTKKRLFAETLLNIALCCYEVKEFDRASFFSKKVTKAEESLAQNSESLAECYLLMAKLKFQRKAYEDALDFCRQSYEKGDKMVRDRRRVCEMYYIKGKCYQELRKKDKAFEAFKSARKIVEYIKDPYLNEALKNKIDDAFLNIH